MRMLKKFREFLEDGTARRQSPNRNRAESLIAEAKAKKAFMETVMQNTPKEKIYPNFVIDSCYDIIIELVRSKMLVDGFSSDSHEAGVSYMGELGFSEFDVRFMDELRWYRNGIKYYGKILDTEYAGKVSVFLNKIYPKLERLFR